MDWNQFQLTPEQNRNSAFFPNIYIEQNRNSENYSNFLQICLKILNFIEKNAFLAYLDSKVAFSGFFSIRTLKTIN